MVIPVMKTGGSDEGCFGKNLGVLWCGSPVIFETPGGSARSSNFGRATTGGGRGARGKIGGAIGSAAPFASTSSPTHPEPAYARGCQRLFQSRVGLHAANQNGRFDQGQGRFLSHRCRPKSHQRLDVGVGCACA